MLFTLRPGHHGGVKAKKAAKWLAWLGRHAIFASALTKKFDAAARPSASTTVLSEQGSMNGGDSHDVDTVMEDAGEQSLKSPTKQG